MIERFVDILEIRFDLVIEKAMQKLDIFRDKLRMIQSAVSDLRDLRNVEKELRSVGLAVNSAGKPFDLLTNKLVSSKEVFKRFYFLDEKGTFFGKTAADIADVADVTPRMNKGIGQAQSILNDVMNNMDKYDDVLSKSKKSTSAFHGELMSLGFALTFGGMALKAFSQQMLTSLVTAFTAARDEGDFLSNKVLGVSAAFEFLKFSIFDAFANSDMFIPIIDGIINMTNWLSQFIAKFPGLASFTVVLLGILTVVGGIAMVFGQLALAAFGFGIGLSPLIGIILLIGSAIAALFVIFSSNMSTISKIILSIVTLLIVGIVASLILVGKTSTGVFAAIGKGLIYLAKNPLFWLISGFALVVTALYNMQDAMGGVWNFGKAFLSGLFKAVVLIGGAIYDFMLTPTLMILKALKSVSSFFGLSGLSEYVEGLESSVKIIKQGSKNLVNDLIEGIDKGLGTDKIRENLAENGKTGFLDLISGGSSAPTLGNFDSGDSIISGATTELESQQSLGGGASLADLQALEQQSLSKQDEMIRLQQDTVSKLDNTGVTLNASGLFDEQGLFNLLDQYFKDRTNTNLGSTQGG